MASGTTVRVRSIVVFASVALPAGATFATVPAIATSATAFVRVNQVGYPAASAKRAFLMASDAETGATFSVSAGGSAVFSGGVGADLGAWSTAYPHVYALDFTSFSTAGTYSIDVAGPIPASSPSFRIDTGSALYSQPLTNARSFFGNERDGAEYIPSALRTAPAHLNDQNAMTYLTPHANQTGHFKGDLTPLDVRIDASGGWWDAGDYLKFVQTSSYTEDLLLAGVRDMPGQMGAGSTTSNFTAEAKFGTSGSSRCGTTRPERPTTRLGSGPGTRRRAVTTTSGDCHKQTMVTGEPILSIGMSGTGPSSAQALLDRS
jgi:endoglucanase